MTIKTLLLAGVLSLAAMSVAYASDGPGNPTDGTGRSHASAAPACGDQCPMLATDTGPGSPGDDTGRSGARMAGDGPPAPIGGSNGRSSAALSKGGAEFLVAASRPSNTGEF